jgi:hypothetical protein
MNWTQESATGRRASEQAGYFLSQFLGLHLRLDNLQSDCSSCRLAVDALFCAIANGKAAFAKLVSC